MRASCQTFKMGIVFSPHFLPFYNHWKGQKSCFLIKRVLKRPFFAYNLTQVASLLFYLYIFILVNDMILLNNLKLTSEKNVALGGAQILTSHSPGKHPDPLDE